MQNNSYTRIDDRLVMVDESRPTINRFDELNQTYNSRPSYLISPTDRDKFKEGESYELDKDFELKTTNEWCQEIGDEWGAATKFPITRAFAITKDNDLAIQKQSDEWDEKEFYKGFEIKVMENKALQNGMGILMLNPQDFKKYKNRLK